MGNPYSHDNPEECEAFDQWAEEEKERTVRHTPKDWRTTMSDKYRELLSATIGLRDYLQHIYDTADEFQPPPESRVGRLLDRVNAAITQAQGEMK